MFYDLILEELVLEKEARGITVKRLRTKHLQAEEDNTYSETFLGKNRVKCYLQPFAEAVETLVTQASKGRAGPKALAVTLIKDEYPYLISFLTLKGIFNSVGIQYGDKQPTLTFVARTIAEIIHEELRLATFEKEHKTLSDKVHAYFNSRELARYKKQEYMKKAFKGVGLERRVALSLTAKDISFEFETEKISKYNPDFLLEKLDGSKMYLESKGRFLTADRQKHLLIRDQHPDLDIRFVFQQAHQKISKASKTTYAKWSDTHDFKWSDKGFIPQEWLDEC